MPLLRFDLIEGRTDAVLKVLLDAAHSAMLLAFEVPERDRYQIVHEHKRTHMIIEDTGLGLERSDKAIENTGLHENAVCADACLSGVAELRRHRPGDRLLKIGIVEDDKGRVSAKLQRQLLDRVG